MNIKRMLRDVHVLIVRRLPEIKRVLARRFGGISAMDDHFLGQIDGLDVLLRTQFALLDLAFLLGVLPIDTD